MSLSEEEHHAWGHLERSLARGAARVPAASHPGHPTLTIPTDAYRRSLPRLILVIGIVVVLAGVLIGVPLLVIVGISVLAIHGGRERRRARPAVVPLREHRPDPTG